MNGTPAEDPVLQGLPQGGLWHCCAHMSQNPDVGASTV